MSTTPGKRHPRPWRGRGQRDNPDLGACSDGDRDGFDDETAVAPRWLPELIGVTPRAVCLGRQWASTLVVVGFPPAVYPGWLDPLLHYPARIAVSVHITPIPTPIATRGLRRQLARLESARALDADKGRLADPRADAAATDAHELSARLARGETRLHRVGLSITLHAATPDELADHRDAITALAASMLLDTRPTTYRALAAWSTSLPLGLDLLAQHRTLDTDALASLFPFTTPDLPSTDPVDTSIHATIGEGVLYGINPASGGLVVHDRFAAPNHNAVILATSGAGKSYLTKLETLRSLYQGVEVLIIDPEDEYARLAAAVGGTHLRLGAPGVRINPLDIPHPTPTPASGAHAGGGGGSGGVAADALTRRALYLHTVLGVLCGELDPHERVLLDRAIHTTYTRAGITLDPTTWTRPAPLLGDLAHTLTELADPGATSLAQRLTPYVSGSFSTLFAGPTTTAATGHLVVFSLKDLPDELRAIATLLALDATWRTVADPTRRRRRLVVVDEAWLLLQHAAGAGFLLRLAKSARKHWAGLTLITQDAADVLGTELGRSVVSNAATHILLRTATHAAPTLAAEFGLSDAAATYLRTVPTGSGLLLTHHGHHVAFSAQASAIEDELCTSDPAQLATLTPLPHTPDPSTPTSLATDTGPSRPAETDHDAPDPL